MAGKIVTALFESKGIAEDAYHRLVTEGIPALDVSLRLLKEVGPVPETMAPELDALDVDPFLLGNVRENYVSYIRNGETALCVRAHSDEAVELAVGTIRQYVPIDVRVISPEERRRVRRLGDDRP